VVLKENIKGKYETKSNTNKDFDVLAADTGNISIHITGYLAD